MKAPPSTSHNPESTHRLTTTTKISWVSTSRTLGLCLALTSLAWPASATKPERLERHAPVQQGSTAPVSVQIQIGSYFAEPQRTAVRSYYGPQLRSGKCPPGLAKKGRGCQPPGQTRPWQLGQSLPSSVVFYPVPRAVSLRIGLPPAGHEYVRVAADILLIAMGTRLVVDAIEDLSGR
jgi:hypothetical protein